MLVSAGCALLGGGGVAPVGDGIPLVRDWRFCALLRGGGIRHGASCTGFRVLRGDDGTIPSRGGTQHVPLGGVRTRL